jgi:hypothetical protein
MTQSFEQERLQQYEAFGQAIASDFPFRDLKKVPSGWSGISICRTPGNFPALGALLRTAGGDDEVPLIRVYEDESGIQYIAEGVARFHIEPTGARIWYELAPDHRAFDVESLILGPILGYAMQNAGGVQLHAGAVAVNGRAFAFAGSGGLGKSTLAGALMRSGCDFLSDDVLPLDLSSGRIFALPSAPKMRLWEDSVRALSGDPKQYEAAVSWVGKLRITTDKAWGNCADVSVPLGGIYLLEPHLRQGCMPAFKACEPVEATLRLLANTYLAESLRGVRATSALETVSTLARTIPVRRVSYFRSYDRLPEICSALIADATRLHD